MSAPHSLAPDTPALSKVATSRSTRAAACTMGTASAACSSPPTAASTASGSAGSGRGTGIDDEMWEQKVSVIRRALARHRPDPADPLAVPVVQAAARVLRDVATFDSAGVSGAKE